MNNTLKRHIAFSAYCLGTVAASDAGEMIGITNRDDFIRKFNDWLQCMPLDIARKWDGEHVDVIRMNTFSDDYVKQ